MSPKNFIHINESFKCGNCGHINGKNPVGCRNHCTECLYSLHVDLQTPGDRNSDCKALMQPTAYYHDSKKGYVLQHSCSKCGKQMHNKLASDDNMEVFLNYIEKRLIHPK